MNVHAQSLHFPRMACWSLWYSDRNLAGGSLNTHVLFHPSSWHRGQLKPTQGGMCMLFQHLLGEGRGNQFQTNLT